MVKIQKMDIVKRLEEESAHLNVGIVPIVHLHTDARAQTHIYYMYRVYAHMDTHIFRF